MCEKFLLVVVVAGALASAHADDGKQRETFGKWRVGIGGAFNGAVDARLRALNAPVPRPTMPLPAVTTSREEAKQAAANRVYDGGGFIRTDSDDDGVFTTNWQLPEDTYLGNGRFLPKNAYCETLPGANVQSGGDSARDRMQFGVSAEVSRELWIHDENDKHRWGVDFAAAFSYFFQRDVYRARGCVARTDTLRNGVFETPVDDPDATFFYDMGWDSPSGGMYGYGNFDTLAGGPALKFAGVGETVERYADTLFPASCGFLSSGDYQELEMLFMLRPWYEITDWWRVFAQVGVGVSWGRFDSTFRGYGISADEEFAQWDCYGVAGLGTAFRYGHWDIGIDFLGRFLRDDLDADGRYVSGSIERANWGFRVMLGYSF